MLCAGVRADVLKIRYSACNISVPRRYGLKRYLLISTPLARSGGYLRLRKVLPMGAFVTLFNCYWLSLDVSSPEAVPYGLLSVAYLTGNTGARRKAGTTHAMAGAGDAALPQ